MTRCSRASFRTGGSRPRREGRPTVPVAGRPAGVLVSVAVLIGLKLPKAGAWPAVGSRCTPVIKRGSGPESDALDRKKWRPARRKILALRHRSSSGSSSLRAIAESDHRHEGRTTAGPKHPASAKRVEGRRRREARVDRSQGRRSDRLPAITGPLMPRRVVGPPRRPTITAAGIAKQHGPARAGWRRTPPPLDPGAASARRGVSRRASRPGITTYTQWGERDRCRSRTAAHSANHEDGERGVNPTWGSAAS